jgi:TRAP-type C4-dicarboxylate transport system permease small subunit
MSNLFRAASLCGRLLAYVGAAGVVMMMLHICADIVARNLFSTNLASTAEMVSRYYMVALAFMPIAWVELRGEMISVELIDGFLRPRMLRAIHIAVALVCAVIYAALTWATWGSMVNAIRMRSYIELGSFEFLTWPSFLLPTGGFALAALACLVRGIEHFDARAEIET